ncbi:MAG: cyclase family protein [Bacteroidales bacterium]|nr:cyclase family protein [Bacteroidales bacterium]
MKITDLSHVVHNHMPVYPGTEEPFIEHPFKLEAYEYNKARLRMVSHTGTHMDAPAHMLSHGLTLDRMPPGKFFGKGRILDVRGKNAIDSRFISYNIPDFAGIDFLLLFTGWSDHWGKESYFSGYPCLDREAAEFLSTFTLKGIGIDAISFDKEESTEFTVHKILLEKEILLIENLTNLEQIGSQEFWLVCAPLKFENSDGAPTRVISIEGLMLQNSEVK